MASEENLHRICDIISLVGFSVDAEQEEVK